MSKWRNPLVVLTCLALGGCDGAMRIKGNAPPSGECVIHLVDAATGAVATSFVVDGEFEERVFFAGARRAPEMTLTATCDGKVVATVSNPPLGEVDLGNLAP